MIYQQQMKMIWTAASNKHIWCYINKMTDATESYVNLMVGTLHSEGPL